MLSITIAWAEPAGNGAPITGYKLFMAEMSQAFVMVFDGTNRADIRSYTVVKGVQKTLTYHFKLVAINNVGMSDYSPVLSSFIAVVPSMPQDFKYTESASSSISLEWLPPRDDGGASLTGFFIYYKVAGAVIWDKSNLIASDLFHYQLIGLTADTNYAIKMVAVNVKGESEFTPIIYQYASAVPQALQQPQLVAGTRTTTSVQLQMYVPGVSSTDVLGYKLYVNEVNSFAIPSVEIYDG